MATISPETESVLRGILRTAQSMQSLVGGHPTHVNSASQTAHTHIPSLVLPFPHDILKSLYGMKLPDKAALDSSSKLTEWVTRLQAIHVASYESTCRNILSIPSPPNQSLIAELRMTYEDSYSKRYLPLIRSHIMNLRMKTCDMPRQRDYCKQKKSSFNSEYTPLLEKYFEHNAYPSAPDRLVLARKSMMTARQIEVWFQNHRTRARKEGRPLKKLNHEPLPAELSLESLKERMPLFTIPVECENNTTSDLSEDDVSDDGESTCPFSIAPSPNSPNPLNPPAPVHAFPTVYPSPHKDNVFPMHHNHLKLPSTVWARKPASPLASSAPIDFDHFVETFAAKLHLRDGISRKLRKGNSRSVTAAKRYWLSPTVTRSATAPHPALIIPSAPSDAPSAFSFNESQSNHQYVQSPSSGRNSYFAQPPQHTMKFARAPKRVPRSAPYSLPSRSSSSSTSRSCSNSSASSEGWSTSPSSPSMSSEEQLPQSTIFSPKFCSQNLVDKLSIHLPHMPRRDGALPAQQVLSPHLNLQLSILPREIQLQA